MYHVIKAGKLANGSEKGKGSVVHLSKHNYFGPAICGAEPRIQWIERPELQINCDECLKSLRDNHYVEECNCSDCKPIVG